VANKNKGKQKELNMKNILLSRIPISYHIIPFSHKMIWYPYCCTLWPLKLYTTGPKGNGGNNKMGHGATARIVEFECSPRNHDEDNVTGFTEEFWNALH
jgi:hypothetical protein